MKKTLTNYKPADLAKMYGVHSNTIRLYESLGYLSPAERSQNGYRIFTDLHALQVKICRCIFGYPFTNRRIRNAGNEVMWASGKQQWSLGKENASKYIQVVKQEYALAKSAASILQTWAQPNTQPRPQKEQQYLSRKDVAATFGITIEAVRNWERNGLIYSESKGSKAEVLYNADDLERLNIIYMLRQTGYSIAAIHHSISMYDKGRVDKVVRALHEPEPDELISVGDRWQHELSRLYAAAQNIPPIFDELAAL